MNEILLYLSLKHYGEWMAIYDSLQKREQMKVYDIKKATNEIDCDWITLISDDYPLNLKDIYKPPFGLFVYGESKLLNQNIVTIYGQPDETNTNYLEYLKANKVNLLWIDKTNRLMLDILNRYKTNNIFYIPELKNEGNKTFQNILADDSIIMNNAFVSEIWQRVEGVDYTSQIQERIYLGLTKKLLILETPKAKDLLAMAKYCEDEHVKVAILKSAFNERVRKEFSRSDVTVIDEISDLNEAFWPKK